jgi:hypothetical protein
MDHGGGIGPLAGVNADDVGEPRDLDTHSTFPSGLGRIEGCEVAASFGCLGVISRA